MAEEGAWGTLKEADQLTIERGEGNVFHGFNEGESMMPFGEKIFFYW